MKLRWYTFILLNSYVFFTVLEWGKTKRIVIETHAIYLLYILFVVLEALFLFSIHRYHRLGKPMLKINSCLNKHLLVTGAFLAIIQAVFTNYHYHLSGAGKFSVFLFYLLNAGVCTLLVFLQINNFIRTRAFCCHGISGPGITVFWEDIEEYRWLNRETILITCKNDFVLFKIKTRLRWTVPRGLRNKLDELLLGRDTQ